MTDAPLAVSLRGRALLNHPILNKSTAFTEEERRLFGLRGLLPPHVTTLDEQAERSYHAYSLKSTPIEKHIYLRALQDRNETLFYRVLLDHLEELMPVIYTPVVGEACQRFSEIYRKPRGLFLSYPQRGQIEEILAESAPPETRVIVVTDGERILGLGDQGVNGMGIPIGKLSLYTACGGIDPRTTLPIVLDCGTNNHERLKDPLYIGWRHERISREDYTPFLDEFVQAVRRRFPRVLLQFEDFAHRHAVELLRQYRDQLCCFNDDIQGTAAVTAAALLASLRARNAPLREERIVVAGAGSAGIGIADQLSEFLKRDGLSEEEAHSRFFLLNRHGLLREGGVLSDPDQARYQQPASRLNGWQGDFGLADVIRNVKPTILIGVSTQPGMFTEEIVREMAKHVERPAIFPLSNPSSKTEARPEDLIRWTGGRALIATGSPFAPVEHGGTRYPIAQCNNSYIFPGLGLGVLACGAERVTDGMFMAAAAALAELSPARTHAAAPLLPPLDEIRGVSRAIALATAMQAVSDGVAPPTADEEMERAIAGLMWSPRYRPYVRAD